MMNPPITANPAATTTLTVLVTRVRPAIFIRTGRGCPIRRPARRSLSQARAMISSGNTIPNT
jgi:hypothetical protein